LPIDVLAEGSRPALSKRSKSDCEKELRREQLETSPPSRKYVMKRTIVSKFKRSFIAHTCQLAAKLFVACTIAFTSSPGSAAEGAAAKPTIVLVHGAMADSSSWNSVISKLQTNGYTVVAAANPLRSLKGDADYVAGLVKTIKGPIVLVGHSYGGAVITSAATGNDDVKALVYVAAFAPDKGESAFDLVGKFPGSLLGAALAASVALSVGGHDLYLDQVKFREPFAADLPEFQVRLMAATLRPVMDAALKEPSDSPAWKTISSWFIYGSADKSIPAQTHAFMAKRAGAKNVVVVKDASHVVMISQPAAVAHGSLKRPQQA
jgi:pimeloyl-ACP methyl ester carboxylesterase